MDMTSVALVHPGDRAEVKEDGDRIKGFISRTSQVMANLLSTLSSSLFRPADVVLKYRWSFSTEYLFYCKRLKTVVGV